jgi:monoamine oxidase
LFNPTQYAAQAEKARAEASQEAAAKATHVGIIGAGITGLYAAFLLKEVGIDFTILEADSSRAGGRIFTHHFNKDLPHQYAEVGAMRLPFSAGKSEHQLVFATINLLNARLRKSGKPSIKLIPFLMNDDKYI